MQILLLICYFVGNCCRGSAEDEKREAAKVVDDTAPGQAPSEAPVLPVEGGPFQSKPLPRKFSSEHLARFSPGNEKPQGSDGQILNFVASENKAMSPHSNSIHCEA